MRRRARRSGFDHGKRRFAEHGLGDPILQVRVEKERLLNGLKQGLGHS